MSALAKVTQQPVRVGTCKGTINSTDRFEAQLVVLSKETFPLPHGEAHVMQATDRGSAPAYKKREVNVSFSLGNPNKDYGLSSGDHIVHVIYVESSVSENPVRYTQCNGIASVAFDPDQKIFSGVVTVTMENKDEDTIRTINLKFDFMAMPPPPQRRISRRPRSRKANG